MVFVMMFHFSSFLAPELSNLGFFGSVIYNMFSVGWVGVDVFLVISGYLIADILGRADKFGFEEFKSFITKRLKRLFAPYVLLLIAVSYLSFFMVGGDAFIGNTWTLWTLFSNVYLSFYDRGGLGNQYIAMFHLWSIAIEIHFYLLFSLAFLTFKNLFKFSLLMIIVAVITRWLLSQYAGLDNAIYSFTFSRVDAFAIGVVVYILKDKLLIDRRVIGIAGFALFLSVSTGFYISGYSFKSESWIQIFGYTLFDLSIGLIVLYVTSSRGHNSCVTNVLELNALKWIGVRSYSFYLVHLPIYPAILIFSRWAFNHDGGVVLSAYSIGIMTTVIAGLCSYNFVEKKFTTRR